jgi:hypothetical protein
LPTDLFRGFAGSLVARRQELGVHEQRMRDVVHGAVESQRRGCLHIVYDERDDVEADLDAIVRTLIVKVDYLLSF